jgi:hypothetical protein
MNKSIPFAASLLIAGLFAASASAQNLIVNGDFELGSPTSSQTEAPGSPALQGWIIGVAVDYVPTGMSYWPGNQTRWVDLTGRVGGGWIEQTIVTEIGATYSLSCNIFNGSSVYSSMGPYTSPVMSVSVTGGSPQPITVSPGAESLVTVSFVASQATTTLRFSDLTGLDTNGAWIDNVSVIKTASAPVIEYPAAPAIATHYLQSLGLKPNSVTFKNYVSKVAAHMTPGAKFEGLAPSDPGYAQAVIDWMVDQFGVK